MFFQGFDVFYVGFWDLSCMDDVELSKGEEMLASCVEAMSSKVILMMPMNHETSKIQRFKNQVSWIKIQE